MAQTSLAFGLLGPLPISADGAPVPLGSPKQRVVLATLLMNRNRTVAVDSLIAAAWEDDPPAEARTNIHVYVSNLRRLLAVGDVDARMVLEKRSPGYQFNVDEAAVDVGRFLRANSAGVDAAAARRFEEASRHLRAALAEWRGPVLEDLRQYQFIDAFAVALTEHKMAAHAAHAEAEISCGRAAAVVGELETLVAEHPYREPVWAQLMTAYYLAGRQSDALDAYRRLTALLDDDLGIDPNAMLRDLHGRILRQERLDVAQSAQATAEKTLSTTLRRSAASVETRLLAWLHAKSGARHPVHGQATPIGRRSDNDIVLDDAKVSRRHAVIVDTGIRFVIFDAGSANGVVHNGQRIVGSAALDHGDLLRIGNSEFIFELQTRDDGQTLQS
jgi:SARP family transcriptional regulator, regulator of embCAB operon